MYQIASNKAIHAHTSISTVAWPITQMFQEIHNYSHQTHGSRRSIKITQGIHRQKTSHCMIQGNRILI